MTDVLCDYMACESNIEGFCTRSTIHLANNLHDGATCMDTHFVNKREEVENGNGGPEIRQTED